MTHLLDTSALLAHYLDEPGADQVENLLAQGPAIAALAAPSWVELDARLRELVNDTKIRESVFEQYTCGLTTLVPVDSTACLAARVTVPSADTEASIVLKLAAMVGVYWLT